MPKPPPKKTKLNDLYIKRLKPDGERPYLVWDTYQRGLAIQVQPTGTKAWKCIYPFHSKYNYNAYAC